MEFQKEWIGEKRVESSLRSVKNSPAKSERYIT